jgi:hypothetical protein
MKRNLLFIFIITALLMGACAIAPAATPAPSLYRTSGAGGAPQDSGFLPGASEQKALPVTQAEVPANAMVDATGNPVNQDRIVIQNADLSIVVKDPEAKMLEIGAMAQRLGGFVVSSNMGKTPIDENSSVSYGNISIRVPAKDLDTALNEIKADTVEVQTENRSGEDVTDKYVDLQSQLKAKQAAETKLYEILDKTEKAEDTLLVFNQLTQIQSDIEVLKGQINYYEQASALSAISVRLVAEETIQPIKIAGWQPQGQVRDAVQALINFFQGFVNFLIWLVILIIPVAAVIIALLALLWRLLRWFWRKVFPKKTAPTPPPAPVG